MLDHIILTVSDVERSLAFYEVALKPLLRNMACFFPQRRPAPGRPALPRNMACFFP
jgi:hypothetical protein